MTEAQAKAIEEAHARWQGAEYKYAKNPSHVTRVRVEKARAELAKLKAKYGA